MKGSAELQRKLRAVVDSAPKKIASALYTETVIVEMTSRERTPVLTGALRASHETLAPVVERDEVSCQIQVGGPAAPYAIAVHEKVEVRHKVGQAKFLESAVLESAPTLAERVARRIKL